MDPKTKPPYQEGTASSLRSGYFVYESIVIAPSNEDGQFPSQRDVCFDTALPKFEDFHARLRPVPTDVWGLKGSLVLRHTHILHVSTAAIKSFGGKHQEKSDCKVALAWLAYT